MKFTKLSPTAFAIGLVCCAIVGCGPNPNPNGVTETGRIVGTLIDASTNQALPSATIVVGTIVRNVVSSDGGKFSLDGVPIGNQTLIIRAIGYVTETETILVTNGNTSKAGDTGLVRLQSTLRGPVSRPSPSPSP